MPPKRRRKFKRRPGNRLYKKMFVLATEGSKTESQYFEIFKDLNLVVRIELLKKIGKGAPPQVLERMRKYLKQEGLKSSDEAWLVIDKDNWTDGQLSQLHEWAQEADNYGFALSNPKFEFWLLLHFEDGSGVNNSKTCSRKLERHIPRYDKGIDARKIFDHMIKKAIKRAKERDTPACRDWPRNTGTTVYRLVQNILKSRGGKK